MTAYNVKSKPLTQTVRVQKAQRGGVTAQQCLPQGRHVPCGAAMRRAAEFQLREIRLIRSAERKNESIALCVVNDEISGETDPPQLLVDRQTENIGG